VIGHVRGSVLVRRPDWEWFLFTGCGRDITPCFMMETSCGEIVGTTPPPSVCAVFVDWSVGVGMDERGLF